MTELIFSASCQLDQVTVEQSRLAANAQLGQVGEVVAGERRQGEISGELQVSQPSGLVSHRGLADNNRVEQGGALSVVEILQI